MLSLTTDQLSGAAAYISRNWGDHGYRIRAIESPTLMVSLFYVTYADGSRFTVAADHWGNCRAVPPGDGAPAVVAEMHRNATAA